MEFVHYLVSHGIAAGVDAGTNRGVQVFAATAKYRAHRADSALDDALDRSPPTGVKRAKRSFLRVGNQYRDTIGHLDRQNHIFTPGDDAVAPERTPRQ